jgi:hypothetical protein
MRKDWPSSRPQARSRARRRAAALPAAAVAVLAWLLPTFAVDARVEGAPAGAAATPNDAQEIHRLLAEAGTSADYPDADVLVVFDRTEVDVEESGLSHVRHHLLSKILTGTGARDEGYQRFDYDPDTQALEVLRVAIHRAGGTIETVDASQLRDVAAPAHAIYWGARMKCLQLPRLEVGDAVEVQVYRKGFQIAYLDQDERFIPPMRGHFYDVIPFQGPRPALEKSYLLRTPRDKPIQYAVYNGPVFAEATFTDSLNAYHFWQERMDAAVHEWRSPGATDYVPKVVLATVQDWPAKSRWFWEANAGQFGDNEAIRRQVAEITRGLKDDQKIISAINHWVAQNIRYCGLDMGEGEGYTLHPGDMIFRERSGVCKDIAGMTITMLRSAGFEVYPAMTMAGARVESTPADQFNHCVAALRCDDGSYQMLDPTWIPFAMADWSRAEGQQQYVIGTPWGEELTETRPFSAEENRVRLQVQGRVAEDGTLAGRLAIEGQGYSDTRLRRSLGMSPLPGQEQRLARWLSALAPDAELTSWRATDPRDFTKPVRIELEFRLPGYALLGDGVAVWQACAPRLVLADYAGTFRFVPEQTEQGRQTPALIWFAQQVQIDERIDLPRGLRTAAPPGEWETGDPEDIAAAQLSWRPDGRRLELTGTFAVRNRTILPEQWKDFARAVDVLERAGQQRLVAHGKGD